MPKSVSKLPNNSIQKQEEDYWADFINFCRYEIWSGGPDPQMPLLSYISKGFPRKERIWLAGCYTGVYDVSTAEYIWKSLRPINALDIDKVLQWTTEHWSALILRNERRCVRSPRKLATFLNSYATWAQGLPLLQVNSDIKNYDLYWESVQNIKFVGRYSAMKLLRCLEVFCDFEMEAYDIRAFGGWSPRLMLSKLYPENKEQLIGINTKENLIISELVAKKGLENLQESIPEKIGCYELQVLLCEFRELLKGNRFYPGRSHDEVLENLLSKIDYRSNTKIFEARKSLFPLEHLGELNFWRGIRKPLQSALLNYGYIWSDILYDYDNTKDFSQPIKRYRES